MPFSESGTCTEADWNNIFQEVIKPAVEASSYECRRSTATRGNLIKAIIQDLDASWVVLADLTDRNPNVFYELGVRHALKDRTILIAQNREDIPFDLQSYANHVYDWRTEDAGRKLDALLDLNALPTKGYLSRADREREAEEPFAAARRAHPAIESAINGLEHRGLDRVRSHGADGFARTVALSVLAANLHRIGLLLQKRERKRRRLAA